jgi:KDO2-lipid IV(A) lauroyltransferase
MSKRRYPIADYAVYLAVRIVVCLLQALSFRSGCELAKGLAWLIYKVDRRHRLVALDNLHHAFGECDPIERDRQIRAVYLHFCTMLIEIVHLPRLLYPHNWKRYITIHNHRSALDVLLTGRPVLVVSGHFGNWEFGGYTLALFGFRTNAIARPLDNPHVDAFLRRFREHTGQQVLKKDGDFDRIQNVLATGGILLTLGDQDAGQKGQFVDFFNRPASTHKAVALLALEYNVPMIVMTCSRASNDGGIPRYEVEVPDIIDPQEYKNRPDAVPALTQRFTTALENAIRHHPEQYFWLHRRWKHQPKSRSKRGKAA